MAQVIGAIILLCIVWAVVKWLIINIIIPFAKTALMVTFIAICIGVLIGGGNAIYNYLISFRNNVKQERI